MLALQSKVLTESFLNFASQASNILHIRTQSDYKYSLDLIQYLFDRAKDSRDDPLNDLIEIISRSIEKYESKQQDLVQFDKEAKDIDSGVSILRTLIDQYNLSFSDFEREIGPESLVSMIIEGRENLTREHITNLSRRFKISPSLFFDI